ncbi:XRE family transcriptional regulator [Mariniphaga sediminis]|uniref:XRE family transcriptional regulator n=1 Tax=Mariniphaga sediminis TaxID=1628158 RepID=A0A399CYH0_9BACT|nr:helix-turn-helix transcriptional regulator [Mariniphaga sediminis]RIH63441.1 XRE family transcriptional regulator [Mariniphaga sediminis]
MNSELKIDLLSRMIKEKRGSTGLRTSAQEIGGISAPTLSRIEKGNVPDVDTFIKICKWLGVSTDTFINSEHSNSRQKLIGHLRADRELEPDTIEMLVKLIDMAYKKL